MDKLGLLLRPAEFLMSHPKQTAIGAAATLAVGAGLFAHGKITHNDATQRAGAGVSAGVAGATLAGGVAAIGGGIIGLGVGGWAGGAAGFVLGGLTGLEAGAVGGAVAGAMHTPRWES